MPRTRSPGTLPPPPPTSLTSARPGWPPARQDHVPAGRGGHDDPPPGIGWQAERTSVLQAINAFALAKGAQWETEHAKFLEEATRLRREIADSYNTPPGDDNARRAADLHDRATNLHTTATLLGSNRKSYRAALERAILDLDAADTPALAAAAINAACSFLVEPAPIRPILSRPASPPADHPPMPLQGYPAAIVSGRLILPDPRPPRARALPSSRRDHHTRAPTTSDPGFLPLTRHAASPLKLSATPSNSGDTPLPRRELGGRRPALLPDPDTLRWAGRHRTCTSIRPTPARHHLSSELLPTPNISPASPTSAFGHLGAVDNNRPPWRRPVSDARPFADDGLLIFPPPPPRSHPPAP
jgi:hypothetical protein